MDSAFADTTERFTNTANYSRGGVHHLAYLATTMGATRILMIPTSAAAGRGGSARQAVEGVRGGPILGPSDCKSTEGLRHDREFHDGRRGGILPVLVKTLKQLCKDGTELPEAVAGG